LKFLDDSKSDKIVYAKIISNLKLSSNNKS
jgi:hypothetical protein